MAKYNYTNFIYQLHELVNNTVLNSCNACFVIRVIKKNNTNMKWKILSSRIHGKAPILYRKKR